jgi:hypothetical protein
LNEAKALRGDDLDPATGQERRIRNPSWAGGGSWAALTGKNLEAGRKNFVHEMAEYAINVIYLTLVFAAFTQYRRLVLAAHDIIYTNYWVAVIQALILGKVIMIGAVFRLGRSLEQRPLIYPDPLQGCGLHFSGRRSQPCRACDQGPLDGKRTRRRSSLEFLDRGPHELLAGSLVIFVALIPFFAIKELGRVLGEEKIGALFFRKADRAGD